MVEIRDQLKITSLKHAWENCGVFNEIANSSNDCLPISDVRNVLYIDHAFAVDEIFKGKKSYIDNVATMETVDPKIINSARETFKNNLLKGTDKSNLRTMFADNLDLTIDTIPNDVSNGKNIFDKLSSLINLTDDTETDEEVNFTHTHVRYFPYLDGHTKCFTNSQGKTNIGNGNVAVVNTSSVTNYFYYNKSLTSTNDGFLQTETAFTVNSKVLLYKSTDTFIEGIKTTVGNTKTITIGQGAFFNNSGFETRTNFYTLSWDGTPCTATNFGLVNVCEVPNNLIFKVCHTVTIRRDATLNVNSGASVYIESSGSIVIEEGGTVNIHGRIFNGGGKIDNNGTINNKSTGEISNKSADTVNNNDDVGIINNNSTGIINNLGSIDNGSNDEIWGNQINNAGTITNEGSSIAIAILCDSNSVFNNSGIINNNDTRTIFIMSGIVGDGGEVNASSYATMNNTGTINNTSTSRVGGLTVEGHLNNESGGIINNETKIFAAGTVAELDNKTGGTFNNNGKNSVLDLSSTLPDGVENYGTFNNQGTITLGEDLINSGVSSKIQNNGTITADSASASLIIRNGTLINGTSSTTGTIVTTTPLIVGRTAYPSGTYTGNGTVYYGESYE